MKPGTKVALLVIGLFALMACAWTALFYAANQAHVESVPLAEPTSPAPKIESTQAGWNALTPTRSVWARRVRVKRLGVKTLHHAEGF